MTIGYTHSLFTGNLRSLALQVDKKENNGNENGLIDGNEINKFKTLAKQKYGINFDFNSITQSSVKEVAIKDKDNNYIYHNSSELSHKYQNNGTNSTTISLLNGGDPFAKSSNKTAKISYMPEADFKKSQEYVNKQESAIRTKIDAKQNEKAQQKQNAQKTPSFWENPIAWLKDRWLRH